MKEWKEYRIKDISKYIGSGTTPTSNSEKYYADEGFLWINTGDLNNGLVFNCKQKITEAAIKDYSTLRFYPTNTVLEAMYGATIGKVGLLQTPATVNQACCAIVPREELVFPKFILYYLIYYKDTLIGKSCGGTQPNVNQKIVANIPIKLPSFETQLRISSCIDSHNKCFDNRISLLNTKRSHFLRLKISIINRTVTKGLDESVEFKDSGIDRIGKIPKHWGFGRVKTISNCVESGKRPTNDEEEILSIGGEHIQNGRFFLDRPKYVSFQTYKSSKGKIESGDTLIVKDGATIGKCMFVNVLPSEKMLLNEHVYRLHMNKYYYYWISSSFSQYWFRSSNMSSAQESITLDTINNLPICEPPFEEQQAIATYLDEKCAKIDAAVANIEKQIDAMKRLKRALINEVVTGKREV